MSRGNGWIRNQWIPALVALALAVRILVPAGWMPSFNAGHATIVLCTGAGMTDGWIDADGKIHKSSPLKDGKNSFPCVFACLGIALGAFALGILIAAAFDRGRNISFANYAIAIGRGLAAPPPPARGPPVLF